MYVNSDPHRIGGAYLTSHLHTISPCHLMSCHLAGDTLLGGDSLSPCKIIPFRDVKFPLCVNIKKTILIGYNFPNVC